MCSLNVIQNVIQIVKMKIFSAISQRLRFDSDMSDRRASEAASCLLPVMASPLALVTSMILHLCSDNSNPPFGNPRRGTRIPAMLTCYAPSRLWKVTYPSIVNVKMFSHSEADFPGNVR